MPKITISDLTVKFNNKRTGSVVALNGLNAEFLSDAFNVVVGYSGCGKTTLLKCIAGLSEHEGSIYFDDTDVSDIKPSDRGVSYVSQEYMLYPHMTVFDNIAFPLKMTGAPKKEISERVKKIAEALDLTYCLTRMPRHISGGQQQRTAIARALIKRPSVCLLDEPLSNTDPQLRYRERRLIKDTVRQYGCTIIYVTHDIAEAMALADKLVVIADGKCEIEGEPSAVYNSDNGVVASLKGKV